MAEQTKKMGWFKAVFVSMAIAWLESNGVKTTLSAATAPEGKAAEETADEMLRSKEFLNFLQSPHEINQKVLHNQQGNRWMH